MFSVLVLALTAGSGRALAAGTVCDPSLAPPDGAWTVRFGAWAADTLEPAFHVRCPANDAAARLTTGTVSAVVLEWADAVEAVATRYAEVSFLVPSLADWSHVALLAAYDRATIGRIGADIFHETSATGAPRDRLTIQVSPTADETCAGSNLHAPVAIAGGIAAGHWYRLSAHLVQRADGGLTVSGVVRDLDAGNSVVAQTRFAAPASCTPTWFPETAGWGVGVLGAHAGVETHVDDFAAFTAPPSPQAVTFAEEFTDAAFGPELEIEAEPGFTATASDGELALSAVAGTDLGAVRITTAFDALGDFTATVRARRDALGAGDALGIGVQVADRNVAVVLAGTDMVAAVDGGLIVAGATDPSAAATLRLRRVARTIVAEIDTGTGFDIVHAFAADVADGRARIGAFLRRTSAASTAAAGAVDHLEVAAEQLTVGDAPAIDRMSYRSAWDAGFARFVPFGPITLVDVLGVAAYDVTAPRALASLAEPAATAFVVEYPVTQSATAPRFTPRAVRAVDECRTLYAVLRRPLSLIVPTAVELGGGLPGAAPDGDHFLCYQASALAAPGSRVITGPPKGTQIEVADGLQARRYDLGRLTKVCNAVDKNGDPVLRSGPRRGEPKPIEPASVRNREPHLVCYQAKPARRLIAQTACGPLGPATPGIPMAPPQPAHARRAVALTNQLGPGRLETIREAEVCLSASVVIPAD